MTTTSTRLVWLSRKRLLGYSPTILPQTFTSPLTSTSFTPFSTVVPSTTFSPFTTLTPKVLTTDTLVSMAIDTESSTIRLLTESPANTEATFQFLTEATTTVTQFLTEVGTNRFPMETSTFNPDPMSDLISSDSSPIMSRNFSTSEDHYKAFKLIMTGAGAFIFFVLCVFVVLFLLGKRMNCMFTCCSSLSSTLPNPIPSIDLEMANNTVSELTPDFGMISRMVPLDRTNGKDLQHPFDDLIVFDKESMIGR